MSDCYLGFDLDEETLELVEQMAREENLTPFEMCAVLLRETVAANPAWASESPKSFN